MDKFATLEPVKLYPSSRLLPRSPTLPSSNEPDFIGRLPNDLHLLVLHYLPLPDIPAYARCSRSTSKLVQDDKIWDDRWRALSVEERPLASLLDDLEAKPPKRDLPSEDEFGEFATGGALNEFSPPTSLSFTFPSLPFDKDGSKAKFRRAHRLLRKLLPALSSPPHLVLSTLAGLLPPICRSLRQQARTLRILSLYLCPRVQPVRRSVELRSVLRSAMDRFDASLLAAFDVADSKGDEEAMREAAESSWDIWEGAFVPRNPGVVNDWEMGKVWAEKREIFYEHGQWNPLDNVNKDGQLDFDAMDEFMSVVLASINEHGARAVRVFPPEPQVLIYFADRLANEVVGEYITSLVARSHELGNNIFLRAIAASFREAWRMVDAIMQAASQRADAGVKLTAAEDVVYRMFEVNMDEYLDEEVESVKVVLDKICAAWDRQTSAHKPVSKTSNSSEPTRFLGTANPAAVKRNVLASFTNVLLLPVTIVPRTVGAVGGAIGGAFRSGVTGGGAPHTPGWGASNAKWNGNGTTMGYKKESENDTVFSIEEDDDDEHDGIRNEKELLAAKTQNSTDISNLDLMLSLDVALELVHADREALKRVETFSSYPGHYGHRVRDTIEEIFILMLQALGERHMSVGFSRATERMRAYKPAEHQETTSVAPLLQFLELVHVGDTIQSMVQVYFDKELAPHIDKTDFLNAVVREKKKFENALDDSVATGLNAGTELLMNQVEHIILTRTKPREYYPPEDAPLELGPTKGCTEAIQCLEMHCKLLKGSTSKEVLEVFHQEVGLRLISILQKHIKRQIISLSGGFQVIADLNAYYAFISSLKVSSITADFSHLKMLGHVYVVEDAKDLAQIVRDVQRYGGAYRPEDIYEFIQRRSDWKKIEKIVDKTMYNLSFKEDCIVC